MKIVSWNVAGISACVKKGLMDFIENEKAEIYCFQEVKASEEKIPNEMKELKNYFAFHCFSNKKGYSGVSVYSKIKPIKIINEFEEKILSEEGRVIFLEFKGFFLINAYFPHAHRELTRLDFKMKFDEAFLNLCKKLEKIKSVVIAADFNVAHKEIDLENPKQNEENAGFTDEERRWFDGFLKEGFVDTFREFNSNKGNYTWWAYRNNCRARNIGWRIDYFVMSECLRDTLKNSSILKDVFGSDHCPIALEIEV